MSVVSIFYDLSLALWFEIDKRKRYGNSLQVPKWQELKKGRGGVEAEDKEAGVKFSRQAIW